MEVLEEGKTLIPAGLLLIASGFSGCEKSVLDAFGLERTKRGVAAAEDYATANPQVFVAGDMRRGPVPGGLGHRRGPRRRPGRGRLPAGLFQPVT